MVRDTRNAAAADEMDQWTKAKTILKVQTMLDRHPMMGTNGNTLRVVMKDSDIWKAMQDDDSDDDMLEWAASTEMALIGPSKDGGGDGGGGGGN